MLQESLDVARDERSCCFEDDNHRLMAGLIYRASIWGVSTTVPPSSSYGATFAPPRVKAFGWLLTKDQGKDPMQILAGAQECASGRLLRSVPRW